MRRIFNLFSVSVAFASTFATVAMAQWSIGAPGTREPPPGLNRYIYMVMSDPMPGREFDFNDGYQNMHMGDLVQLPGWMGAQRFRLVPEVAPRNIKPLYRRGNLIIWDQEGPDLEKLRSDANAAISGGKSRRIPGFDYAPEAGVRVYYRVIGPRTTRPDGAKLFIPAYADNKTPRPNRYIMLDFVEPVAGRRRERSKRHSRSASPMCWRCRDFWRRSGSTSPRRRGGPPANLPFPKYLVMWETEASHPQELQDKLIAATKAGEINALAADPATAQSSWWTTVSPFITKEDFQR